MGHNVNGDHSRRNFLCTTSNQNIVNIQQFKSCTEGINPFLSYKNIILTLISSIQYLFRLANANHDIDINFQNKQYGSSNDVLKE